MKKFLKIAVVLLAAVAVVGCGPKAKVNPLEKGVVAQWHLTESPLLTKDTEDVLDVYVEFRLDKSFTLYQRDLNTPIYYNTYKGTYLIVEDIVSGKYSDGKSWGAVNGYRATYDSVLGTLTLVNVDMPDDVSVFTLTTIPDDVKGGAVRMTTRGEEVFEIVRYL